MEIENFIKEFIVGEIKKANKEKQETKNISRAFKSIGDFGEELATFINPNSYCSASKGGCAFDNFEIDVEGKIINATEVKTCCHIQPKKCKLCNKKCPYYQEKCSFCKNDAFEKIKDSRFSIDTKAHFEYKEILKKYLLIYIFERNDNINVEVFIINSKNEYFNNYLENQLLNSNKSNTCNLLPYSYDFYASGPIKIIDLSFDYSGNCIKKYIDIDNSNSIEFDIKCLTNDEKIKIENLITDNCVKIDYHVIKNYLQIRKKTLNRDRGKITRL